MRYAAAVCTLRLAASDIPNKAANHTANHAVSHSLSYTITQTLDHTAKKPPGTCPGGLGKTF